MNVWLRYFLVGCAVSGFLVWPNASAASVCIGFPNQTAEQVRARIETHFDSAAAVFSGEVISIDYVAVTIRVERTWKGNIGSEVRVQPHVTRTSAGNLLDSSGAYRFERNRKYLVFAQRDPSPLMTVDNCGFTRPAELAAETAKVLDTVVAIRQGGEPDAYARFLALERSWMNALAGRDMPRLDALLAPEFSSTGALSRTPVGTRAQWLQNAAGLPWPKHEVHVEKIHDRGDVVIVHCVLRALFPPRIFTRTGGDLELLATDVWVKRDGAWQVLTRHVTVQDQ